MALRLVPPVGLLESQGRTNHQHLADVRQAREQLSRQDPLWQSRHRDCTSRALGEVLEEEYPPERLPLWSRWLDHLVLAALLGILIAIFVLWWVA